MSMSMSMRDAKNWGSITKTEIYQKITSIYSTILNTNSQNNR